MKGRTSGVTVIEVLIAFALIVFFFAAVAQIMYLSTRANTQAGYLRGASNVLSYVTSEIASGRGETASFASGSGAVDSLTCDQAQRGLTTMNARRIPPTMIARAFGTSNGSSYNNSALYTASVRVTPKSVTVDGVSYSRATYVVSVFYPLQVSGTSEDCLTATIEAAYN